MHRSVRASSTIVIRAIIGSLLREAFAINIEYPQPCLASMRRVETSGTITLKTMKMLCGFDDSLEEKKTLKY